MRKFNLKLKKSEESEAFRNDLKYLDKVFRKGTMICQDCIHILLVVQFDLKQRAINLIFSSFLCFWLWTIQLN